LENRLADLEMPDVTWTGGISELKKIAAMAEAYYVPISPDRVEQPRPERVQPVPDHATAQQRWAAQAAAGAGPGLDFDLDHMRAHGRTGFHA
jgi:galactonate dehydratase